MIVAEDIISITTTTIIIIAIIFIDTLIPAKTLSLSLSPNMSIKILYAF